MVELTGQVATMINYLMSIVSNLFLHLSLMLLDFVIEDH
jgi:hypothetical protein